MREPRYSILADIQDAIERAKQGKLALYWQRTIQREYRCKKVTPAEQQAYEQLQSVLSEVPQWSDEEDLRHNMENIGGVVRFCHFWTDHDSMVQFFFIAPLRHLGKNALQLLIRLLLGRGDFFASVFPLDGALPVQCQLALLCSLNRILNVG